jgi:hypothetical protein
VARRGASDRVECPTPSGGEQVTLDNQVMTPRHAGRFVTALC